MLKAKNIRTWGNEAFRDIIAKHELGESAVAETRKFHLHQPDVKIGGHPDYDYLCDEPDLAPVHGKITTLFVDLNRYTSRTLVMKDDPDELLKIVSTKRLWINALIRFVHMGGGHVHSITGDGVMAFFGGKDQLDAKASGKKALATSLSILYYTKEILNSILEDRGEDTVQIRTGVDFSEVWWLPMGVPGCSEVKAVGYGVDIASKLLSPTKAWKSRVGETLYNELPTDLQEYLRAVDEEADNEPAVFDRQHRYKRVFYKKYFFEWERMISDADGDADQALSLLNAAGTNTIRLQNIPTNSRRSVDDDSVTFG